MRVWQSMMRIARLAVGGRAERTNGKEDKDRVGEKTLVVVERTRRKRCKERAERRDVYLAFCVAVKVASFIRL